MKKYTVEEVKAGSMFVPITEVKLNDWNPKIKHSEEFYKVKRSVELNGQVMPIIVREADSKDYKYEVLDGEQRFTALKELEAQEVWIVNLGKVPDKEARSTTVWLEQAVPFDDNLLGELLLDLKGEVELPYTDEEIELIAGVYNSTDDEEDDEEDDSRLTYTKIVLEVPSASSEELRQDLKDVVTHLENPKEGITVPLVHEAIIRALTLKEVQDYIKEEINVKQQENQNEEDNL